MCTRIFVLLCCLCLAVCCSSPDWRLTADLCSARSESNGMVYYVTEGTLTQSGEFSKAVIQFEFVDMDNNIQRAIEIYDIRTSRQLKVSHIFKIPKGVTKQYCEINVIEIE